MAAPPGTPDDVVKILANAFEAVHKDPEVKKKMVECEVIMKESGQIEK